MTGAVVEQNSAAGSGGSVAVETGEPLEPSAEYVAAGIRRQKNLWYYQEQPIAMIFDDNGGIYMDEEAKDGIYLHVIRDSSDGSFIWTQEKIDETIALYESILEDIQNGIQYSKTVDGQDDVMLSFNPADISASAD